jgi:hypothetical protein
MSVPMAGGIGGEATYGLVRAHVLSSIGVLDCPVIALDMLGQTFGGYEYLSTLST